MATKNGSKGGAKSPASGSGGMSKTLIWVLVAVGVVIVAFLLFRPAGGGDDAIVSVSGAGGGGGGLTNVDANGVLKAQGEGVRVIDVRSQGEYDAGHVPGAENVPIDQFAAASAGWDKSAPLLVYCATGARSSEAVNVLQSAGFKTVYHFDAGLQAWTGSLDTASAASGGAPGGAPAPTAKPTATPVMYEFYTDW